MNTFLKDINTEISHNNTTERGGQPELVVGSTAAVEADNERGGSDSLCGSDGGWSGVVGDKGGRIDVEN